MKSILICDDEAYIRMTLRQMLLELGFDEVMECADGKRAVETALAGYPDIIMLDVSMPEMDGLSAAVAIRKKLKVPIILLTNCHDPATVKRAAGAGIAAFLTKPLREQDLLPAIEISMAHAREVDGLKEQIYDLQELLENRKVISQAKGMLMEREHLSEPEAYRKLQKLAMDQRKTLRQVADGVLRGK